MTDAFAFEAAKMYTQKELAACKIIYPSEIALRLKEVFIVAKETLFKKENLDDSTKAFK